MAAVSIVAFRGTLRTFGNTDSGNVCWSVTAVSVLAARKWYVTSVPYKIDDRDIDNDIDKSDGSNSEGDSDSKSDGASDNDSDISYNHNK